MTKLLLAELGGSFMMPTQASTFAADVDGLFYFIFWVSAAFFVLIAGLMFAFMILYRRRNAGDEAVAQITHNTPLEIAWSVLPGILLVLMFWWGFKTFLDMRAVPANAYEVQVRGVKWAWEFDYPGGLVGLSELHIPQGRPVRLVMSSDNVLHSFYIPAFRAKRDVVPGRINDMWFQADKPGTYRVFCTEYCGQGHSNMITSVTVHPPGEFERWLETADPVKALTAEQWAEYLADSDAFLAKYKDDPELGKYVARLKPKVALGRELYQKKACVTCHTLDGSALTGPSFKGIFEREHKFTDGSAWTDNDGTLEQYIRESILEPNKRIVAGYQGVMPKITISDREIDCIIAFLKDINK
jgi:cytochrome c oxidase subunit 2